jgi:hypothetical protein
LTQEFEEGLTDNPIIKAYYHLDPYSYNRLESLTLTHTDLYGGIGDISSIETEFRSREGSNGRRLHVVFDDVRSLKVFPPGNSRLDYFSFDIETVSDLQWENVIYRVRDDENDKVSFYCKSFTAEIS